MTLFNQVQQLSALLMQVAPEIAMQLGIGDAAMMQMSSNQPTGNATQEASRGSLSAQAANATKESTAPRS
jgi:hypothetical protein